MAPDTGLQPFVGARASMGLPTIPSSPRALRDVGLDEELVDPDARLILSDFTQSIHGVLNAALITLVTEYFPMDMYRSMFFINTLDHDYNRTLSFRMTISNSSEALEAFDQLARKLYDTSLSANEVSKIKLEMSRNVNLMMANRNETLAEATRLYEAVDPHPPLPPKTKLSRRINHSIRWTTRLP